MNEHIKQLAEERYGPLKDQYSITYILDLKKAFIEGYEESKREEPTQILRKRIEEEICYLKNEFRKPQSISNLDSINSKVSAFEKVLSWLEETEGVKQEPSK